jgi:hypothetical protein
MLKGSFTKTRIVIASLGFILLISLFYFLFKKKRRLQSNGIPKLSATFQKKHYQAGSLLLSEFYDLENVKERSISTEKSVSGIRSCKLSLSTEYGFSITKKLKEIPDFKKLKEIQLEFKCWMRSDVSQALYIISIDDTNGKNLTTLSKPIVCEKGFEWNTLHYIYNIEEKFLAPENTIRIYPWNKELREFFIDDIRISYFGENKNIDLHEVNPNYIFDFESPKNEITQTENIKQGIAHSGVNSVDLSNSEEFGPIITKQFGEVCSTPPKHIGMSVWVYPLTDNATAELAVSLFNSKNENYFWKGKSVEQKLLPKDTWTKISTTIDIPQETITLDDVIQIFPRNKGRTKLLFDDLEIVYDDEEQRAGSSSEMNLNSIYKNGFSPKRNTPPFTTVYFQKQEIGNNNSTFIDQKTEPQNDFSPNDQFFSGNFCADENSLDELINIKPTGSGLYSFCNDKSMFTQLWKSASEIDLNSEKIVGDFDNNGTDELLVINKKDKKGKLISFKSESTCLQNNAQMSTVWSAAENLFENWNVSENDVFMSGDFNADKKDDLFIVNSITGEWSILQFMENKSWKSIASNSTNNKLDKNFFDNKKSKQIIGKFGDDKNRDVILISTNNGDEQEYFQLEYNSGKKQFQQKSIINENTIEVFFKNQNTTLTGNFDNDQDEEFINLNTDWRFDLKLVKMDPKGLHIQSALDFRGYPEDHNPKYYEFVKMVAGNFKSKNQTSVLVMMRNCADKNFSGTSCTQFENLNTLPGSTQLYSIKH